VTMLIVTRLHETTAGQTTRCRWEAVRGQVKRLRDALKHANDGEMMVGVDVVQIIGRIGLEHAQGEVELSKNRSQGQPGVQPSAELRERCWCWGRRKCSTTKTSP
jgi:hypothetical protein